MTANAVANYLKKKVLLVTMSLLLDKDLTKVKYLAAVYVWLCQFSSLGTVEVSVSRSKDPQCSLIF